ncbi:MAG: hypothetical protein ACLQVX_21495 [Limisphaerales bacterium]
MDNLENNPPAQTEPESLPTQYDSLRQLVLSVLVLVIVISGTLNVFLLRQAKTSSQELETFRPQVNAIVAQYQKNIGPAMDDFVHKLVGYGKTHPDFDPILTRYLPKPWPAGPTPFQAPAAPANVNKK